MYSPTSYISNPSPSPIHAWNGSTCVLIYKNGSSGGAFLTAKHNSGTASNNVNENGEGTQYNITARYEHPDYDVALLVSDSDLSALPTVTLANAVPDKSGTVPKRIAGWGRTLTGLGGSFAYPRAERWCRGYSVDQNIAEDIKPLNWCVSFVEAGALSNTGIAALNDSGGACFANDSLMLYGLILGVSGDNNYGSSTNGQTVVSLKSWIQSKLGNAAAKFITRAYFDVTNFRARIYFSEAVDWISPGGKFYLTDHDTQVYVDNGNAYGGMSESGVLFIDVEMEATGSRLTGGSAVQTFDIATGAFEIGGVGNVAVTESLVLDLPEASTMGTPIPVSPFITAKLGHNGSAFSNTQSLISSEWDQSVDSGGVGANASLGDPFGRQIVAVDDGSASGSTTVAMTGTISGSRTFGTNAIEAAYVQNAGTETNDAQSNLATVYDCGTDLAWTNGAAAFAATNIANNGCRYRSVTAPYSGIMTIAAGGTDAGNAGAGLSSRCIDTAGNLQGSAVTATTPISFQATSGFRYIFGHLNTSGGALNLVSTAIAMPVGTPTVTNATSPGEFLKNTSGLVCERAATDDASVTHFKIVAITTGTLYKNNGVTELSVNDFITYAEGNAGLRFAPDNPTGGSFEIRASRGNDGLQLSAATATATITVVPPDTSTGTSTTLLVATLLASGQLR